MGVAWIFFLGHYLLYIYHFLSLADQFIEEYKPSDPVKKDT